MTTIKTAIAQGLTILSDPAQHRIDCEILLSFVLNKPRSYLYTHPEYMLSNEELTQFNELIIQRSKGTPIAYLVGVREFWSLPLKVTTDTLIPRPETELIVELTLKLLQKDEKAQILDLGTGCGTIALALAYEKPSWTITACDNSAAALQVAEENAAMLHLSNIQFILSDWFTNIPVKTKFDAIVANPPYIAHDDPHLQQGDLRYEPSTALCSNADGLAALQQIIKQSIGRLKKNGLLLMEHGYLQKSAVHKLLCDYGYKESACWQDLQGHDRVSYGKRCCSGRYDF